MIFVNHKTHKTRTEFDKLKKILSSKQTKLEKNVQNVINLKYSHDYKKTKSLQKKKKSAT